MTFAKIARPCNGLLTIVYGELAWPSISLEVEPLGTAMNGAAFDKENEEKGNDQPCSDQATNKGTPPRSYPIRGFNACFDHASASGMSELSSAFRFRMKSALSTGAAIQDSYRCRRPQGASSSNERWLIGWTLLCRKGQMKTAHFLSGRRWWRILRWLAWTKCWSRSSPSNGIDPLTIRCQSG
jgi:hypothetical protein